MSKQIIYSPNVPAPIGPYSQGVLINNIFFGSGQIALHPQTQQLITDTIENETEQVMQNVKHLLAAAGLGFSDVVKCSIFLSDMALFVKVNEIYGKYFSVDPPARETVAVKTLPKNVNVEISVTAVKA